MKVFPHTDTFIVLFNYTPDTYNKELPFDCIFCSMLIQHNKIRVIGNRSKAEALYKEYNKKYPTEDRELETSIIEPEKGGYFRF